MAQMAEEFGVSKDKIRVEEKSTNTYDQALEFNKMFVTKDIKIGLVTSAYHMKTKRKRIPEVFQQCAAFAFQLSLRLSRWHSRC